MPTTWIPHRAWTCAMVILGTAMSNGSHTPIGFSAYSYEKGRMIIFLTTIWQTS
ncbi:hypothetical protein SEVIR_9G391050v4 [Setaria viridis]|uniref:Uncharacterized protein n=1 Tax=Setaria viridis TaxID=4556 RepID=A0A4U6TF63_SETVI|nr:hypothetical protein SEVIR_9G391050v2 [Setaria viridis]